MNSVLTTAIPAEPTPEEIAQMQAEMHEMFLEAEKTLARMDANWPEIERLRAETRVILDSIDQMMRH